MALHTVLDTLSTCHVGKHHLLIACPQQDQAAEGAYAAAYSVYFDPHSMIAALYWHLVTQNLPCQVSHAPT